MDIIAYGLAAKAYKSHKALHYGDITSDPPNRPDGSPSVEGDTYYNTTLSYTMYFKGTGWAINKGPITTHDHTLTEDFTIMPGQSAVVASGFTVDPGVTITVSPGSTLVIA